jgi:hypothetical protein
MKKQFCLVLLSTLLLVSAAICLPPKTDFSGTWKQSNERCVPERKGNVTRHIDQRGSDLIVETTNMRSSGPPRHALQHYSTDGRTSSSTGTDGDEFQTSVVWKGESLAFSIEEHEDGRVIHSRETWMLIENGSALQIDRVILDASAEGRQEQTLIYVRQAPDVNGR